MTGIAEVVVGSAERLATECTTQTTARCREAVRMRNRFALAIPGGSVLARFGPALAGAPIDWQRVELFWCDERAVPSDDAESNYGAARRALLDALDPHGPHLHPMQARGDLGIAARRYAELESTLGSPPVLDLVLLGVGEDGHVASLFPGTRALHELTDLVVVEPASPKPPPARLTITLPLIALARHVAIAAFGSTKAPAMRDALEDPTSSLPVAMAIRAAASATVYLDDESAALLSGQRSGESRSIGARPIRSAPAS